MRWSDAASASSVLSDSRPGTSPRGLTVTLSTSERIPTCMSTIIARRVGPKSVTARGKSGKTASMFLQNDKHSTMPPARAAGTAPTVPCGSCFGPGRTIPDSLQGPVAEMECLSSRSRFMTGAARYPHVLGLKHTLRRVSSAGRQMLLCENGGWQLSVHHASISACGPEYVST